MSALHYVNLPGTSIHPSQNELMSMISFAERLVMKGSQSP
jgi:hypothetical protein